LFLALLAGPRAANEANARSTREGEVRHEDRDEHQVGQSGFEPQPDPSPAHQDSIKSGRVAYNHNQISIRGRV
jgi:hypothetical protein